MSLSQLMLSEWMHSSRNGVLHHADSGESNILTRGVYLGVRARAYHVWLQQSGNSKFKVDEQQNGESAHEIPFNHDVVVR